jgi:hypothetical protein
MATAPEASAELVKNSGFEELERGDPRAWQSFGTPLLDTSGARSRSGSNAVEVSSESGYIQAVSITPGRTYALSHYSRSDTPESSVRVQVNWLDRRGKIIEVSMDILPALAYWTREELSARAPSRATTAMVFANAHTGQVWLDDYSFALEK